MIAWLKNVRREMRLKKIWKNKIRHKNVKYEVRRGGGYYIPRAGKSPIGYLFDIELKSGEIAVCRLTEIKYFSDPRDMVEESWYTFEGYKNATQVVDCSFAEFKKIYGGFYDGKAK
ncbi:hypothetical protein [Bacillus wiedmannii]|uniref:hypothetical protein n=1 Tax=Bacillus wiedmannii TaxID=1890302 RepID=UPI000BEFEBF1|nr:hypothetical protein [Bacillus wiedmannii]PEM08492.1 hypothetical protein CN610_19760 [Bacillus wiedmannii]